MKNKLFIFLLVSLIAGLLFAIDASNEPNVPRPGTLLFSDVTYWSVNITDNDAQTAETLMAAPGTGLHHCLQYAVINCDGDDTVLLSEDATTILGPFEFDPNDGFVTIDCGETGIQLTANHALKVKTAGASTAIAVFARGYTTR